MGSNTIYYSLEFCLLYLVRVQLVDGVSEKSLRKIIASIDLRERKRKNFDCEAVDIVQRLNERVEGG